MVAPIESNDTALKHQSKHGQSRWCKKSKYVSQSQSKSVMIDIEKQFIVFVLHELILFGIQFLDISKHHSLSLVMTFELPCLQSHKFNFELIGTTSIYAIVVYLITETLPQFKPIVWFCSTANKS